MREVNPEVRVTGVAARATAAWLAQHALRLTWCLTAATTLPPGTKLIGLVCRPSGRWSRVRPLKTDGQLAVFRLDRPDAPC